MTLSDLSSIVGVISGLAVLGSLVFLAAQIRGNTLALRSQSYFNGLTHGQRPFELMIQDPTLIEVVNKGYASPEILSDVELERFELYVFLLFNAWEYFFYQHQDGSIPKQLFLGTDAHMKRLVKTKPGLVTFWDEYRHAYEDPFRSFVSDAFSQLEPPTAHK